MKTKGEDAGKLMRSLLYAFFAVVIIAGASGAVSASEPVVIRVLSANPGTRTYSYICRDSGSGLAGNGIRNWFIYPEDTNVKELVTSLPANQALTYTFNRTAYYDITCEVPNPPGLNYTSLYRHSMHIDLRTSLGNPAVVPLSVGPNKITEMCVYSGTNYSMSWFVSTYSFTGGSGNTVRYSLNTTNSTISFTPPVTPGLYDTHCLIHLKDSNKDIDLPWGVDFPSNVSAPPYVADQYGIDANNNFAPFDYNTWIALHNGTGAPQQQGNINLTSIPGGAAVALNNNNAGVTDASGNLFIQNVPAGLNSIAVSKAGYATYNNNSVSVLAGQTTSLSVALQQNLSAQAGSINLTSSPGNASVSLNGVIAGATGTGSSGSIMILNVSAGTNSISVSLPGYQTYVNNAVNVISGQTTMLNVALQLNPPPGNTTVYTSVKDIPATCSGGLISSDIWNGGRTIVCASGSNNLTVTAWNKPSNTAPQYFEMYKKSQAGSGLQICLLTTCIGSNGYAKSPSFPISG